MVKAESSWPRPQHVAWQSPYLNRFSVLPKSNLLVPTFLNSSTCIFPAVSTFPGHAVPAFPSPKTELTNETHGLPLHPNAETSLKETRVGGALQTVNSASLQKKLLIFDHSGDKTRLFYAPVLPLVQTPTVTAAKFAPSYDVNEKGQPSKLGQKNLPGYSLLGESVQDHTVTEESEYHEDTEEINALLYSDDDYDEDDDDDDCDEVTSTCRSPLVTKRTCMMQEKLVDTKEGVASSDWTNKRLKLIDGGYDRSSPLLDSANLVKPNETCECVSDAESKNSSGWAYSIKKTKVDNSMVGDTKSKKDKIRESLSILENLIPGAKGKEPLLVIDGTIEYLKLLMTQTGTLKAKYH